MNLQDYRAILALIRYSAYFITIVCILSLITGCTNSNGKDYRISEDCVSLTGNNATVIIPVDAKGAGFIQPGDTLRAFTPDGLCAGEMFFDGLPSFLTIWGDDQVTEEIDGLEGGEIPVFEIERGTARTEVVVSLDSTQFVPVVYQADGIFRIEEVIDPNLAIQQQEEIPMRTRATEIAVPYPNPANTSITLNTVAGRLTIYNIIGKKMYSRYYGRDGEVTININGFPSGRYLLKIEERNGNIYSNMFTKTR